MTDRYAASVAQHERARGALAGGVATAFRAWQRPVPISFERGVGSRLWDVDGNEYIDYALAFGPMFLGHSPEPVISAVMRQLRTGVGYGASHRMEAELAEAVVRTVPSAELCAFGSTGSEAVHEALRIARAVTGRRRVVKFLGHYHGWLDPIHVGVPGLRDSGPGTKGQDPAAAAAVTVLPWNDIDALQAAMDDDVAAVIMEPININGGAFVADPAYLQEVRTLTRARGTVLVFDEVITGYRVALGGAQERLGVTPDLTVLGKALGSGFPISAVCGPRSIMAEVAEGRVAHVGTFNLNPIAASAALATVTYLERFALEVYARLESLANELASALVEGAAGAGVPLQIKHVGAAAHAFVSERPIMSYADAYGADTEGYRQLARALLDRGIHVIPRGLLYISTAHEPADIALTAEAMAGAAADIVRQRQEVAMG